MKEDTRERITILSKKDLDISYYKGPGKGGSARNKTSNACLMTHRESGSQGRSSESRSLEENKQKAFQNMIKTPKFKIWLNKTLFKIREEESMEDQIARELENPKNVKYEIKANGKWEEVGIDYFLTEEAKKEA